MTTVAVLAYDMLSPFHLSVPGVVFGELGSRCGTDRWPILVSACPPGRLRTSDGYELVVEHGLDVLEQADIAIVPSWRDPDEPPPDAVIDALNVAHSRGAMVAGLCLGAFVLAAAGLLDGRRATTHWRAADRLAARYPTIDVDPRVLFIDDGDIITSAGTAASIDACLHMVRSRLGSAVANHVARAVVAAPFRDGGQAQYVERPVPVAVAGDPLARTVQWAVAHLADSLSVEVLAMHAHMSSRTFERAFTKAYGWTPAAWIREQRVREAQRLLETTSLSVDRIAVLCGFGSAVTMRQNMVAQVGVSPTAYRRSFQERTAADPPR